MKKYLKIVAIAISILSFLLIIAYLIDYAIYMKTGKNTLFNKGLQYEMYQRQ